jgi:hypothetical protein
MTVSGVSLALIATCVVACGGGGSGEMPPSVMSGSFSPTSGTTASGAPGTEVWWKHRLNGGAATPVTVNGVPGTMQLGDRLTQITSGGTSRVITFDLTLRVQDPAGTVTSHSTNEADDTLMAGPPDALVSERILQNQQISGQGNSLQLALNEMIMPGMPLIDRGDRTDLDQLPVGHTDEQMVRTMVSVTATATRGGTSNSNTMMGAEDDHSVWTVMEQIPSMTVLGHTYERVVKMVVTTDSTDTSTQMVTSSTQTLWLAARIGAIRSEQTNPFLPGPLTAELIDTNLGL